MTGERLSRAVAAAVPVPSETAARMVRAISYLMRVATEAGLTRVVAKLAGAQAELLASPGRSNSDIEPMEASHDDHAGLRH